jgi:flagellar biosynthesis/type III secretory pathway chaperone
MTMKHLIELLDKETKVYNRYLDLAVKKKNALIDNSIEELDLITEEEKALSAKILALEAARVEYLREQGHGSNITLDQLLPKLSENDRVAVDEAATKLRSTLKDCKKITDSNMSLLKQSSSYINHMIKVFTSTINGGDNATYAKGIEKFQTGKIADLQG